MHLCILWLTPVKYRKEHWLCPYRLLNTNEVKHFEPLFLYTAPINVSEVRVLTLNLMKLASAFPRWSLSLAGTPLQAPQNEAVRAGMEITGVFCLFI